MATPNNPYASPQFQPPPPPERPDTEELRALPSIKKSFLKWTLACSLAAGPSFFFGSNIAHPTGFPAACGGMLAGIIFFIVLYVFVERTQRVQRVLAWRFARTTAWIGYGTRVAISIIFPVGMFPDIFCGLFSIGISQWVLGGDILMDSRNLTAVSGGDHVVIFAQFMLTTVVQGVLLNVVLFAYMTLVFGICHLFGSFKKPRR